VVHYATETIDIRAGALVALGQNPHYDLTGNWRPQHPGTHFVRDNYTDFPRLIALRFDSIMADSFPDITPPRVEINDMSLIWGGRYDIGPPRPAGAPLNEYLHWSYPHREHRIGVCMDTNYHGQSGNLTYYEEFKKAILDVRRDYFPQSKKPHEYSNRNHIHVYFSYYTWE
jgi:hypothetical protein